MTSGSGIGASALALALAILPTSAAAAPAPPTQQVAPTPINAAKALMQAGRAAEAKALLKLLAKGGPSSNDIDFLLGMIALDEKAYGDAIGHFRSILGREPNAIRVRLELGRAFFLDGDYANARRQFEFARAGNPAPEVVANIDRYLYAIRQAKSWSYRFGLAVAPDTNINAGTGAREVTLYGLPFELSEETRRQSGIGLAIDAGAEWAPRLSGRIRWRVGANMLRREYSGSKFDDMTVVAYTGPRIVTQRWDLSLLATGSGRWYGANPYNRAGGGRIEATYYPKPQMGLSATLSAQWVDYPRVESMSGPLLFVGAGMIYALTPSSGISLKAGQTRQTAREEPQSYWSWNAAAGYFRDLPAGFSVYVEPGFAYSRYDEADTRLGFDRVRSDKVAQMFVSVLNRRISVARFTPRVSYTFTRQDSSIPLFSFTRNKVEVGLTTEF